MNNAIQTVEDYIIGFPPNVQLLLNQMRATILQNAPESAESISYGMPAFKYLGKPLVYFAAYKTHIGFYATPTGHLAFKNELAIYKQGKGSVQFPINQELPLDLVAKIVQFRVQETKDKIQLKPQK